MDFVPIQFPESDISYISPSFEQLDTLAFHIARQMIDTGERIDRVVTLAKGGWPLTRSMVDYLSVPKVASIGVRFYAGVGQRLDQPEIYQDVPVSVADERVLLFDDVADSGESLIFVKEYLDLKGVEHVTTASLFYKPHSKLEPDFYGATTSAWILFPFERREIADELLTQWRAAGVTADEASDRFTSLSYPAEQAAYYIEKAYAA